MLLHRHLGAVGQHRARVVPALLDEAEDVVPAAAVEAGGVLAQLVEDLVHLEGGGHGLDQHGGADGAARDAEVLLRAHEDVVPEARFEVALQLGQVEVGARCRARGAPARCGRSRGRSRRASPGTGRPSTSRCFSRRCSPRGRTISVASRSVERVALAGGRVGEARWSGGRRRQVELALDRGSARSASWRPRSRP